MCCFVATIPGVEAISPGGGGGSVRCMQYTWQDESKNVILSRGWDMLLELFMACEYGLR